MTLIASEIGKSFNKAKTMRGEQLAHPSDGEEIVISGISGRFPASSNIKEFEENLFSKKDMVQPNRWNVDHPEIPARAGTLKEISKFDSAAFGMRPQDAEMLSPMTRILLEVVFEALYDAGVNPCEVKGTRTGTFVSSFNVSCQEPVIKHSMSIPKAAYGEMCRFTTANRISYILKLNGPSCAMDTGCSTSLHSLEEAYRAIRSGKIDAAIIGGANIDLHPAITIQYSKQGLLSPDGCCKFLDDKANGYVRAETVAAIFLQKKKDARRIYSEIKHCKTGSDGFTEEGITFPSAAEQAGLFSQLYKDCNVNPADVFYVEAHGTGTKAGDMQEATSVDSIFTRQRINPLLIGSVKSNMGHGESVAGLCQIAKAVIVMQTGFITPNLHFEQPRKDIISLRTGRLKVLTDKAPFDNNNGLFAINSYGLGGSNAHVLLKAHKKKKTHFKSDHTRLLIVSGRTYDAVKLLLEDIISQPTDAELFYLLNDTFRWNTPMHRFRGTAIFYSGTNAIYKNIRKCDNIKSKLRFIIGDFSKNLLEVGHEILELPVGTQTYRSMSEILQRDVIKIFRDNDENHNLRAALIHIAIASIIKALDVSAEFINTTRVGVFARAYSNKILSYDEAIVAAAFAVNAKVEKNSTNDNKKSLEIAFLKSVTGVFSKQITSMVKQNHIKRTIFEYLFENDKPMKYLCDTKTVSFAFGASTGALKEETSFLLTLTRIYEDGFNLDINKLYPDVSYPVGRETMMVSPLIKWDHKYEYITPRCNSQKIFHKVTVIDVNDKKWSFLHGHIVDGRKIFPGTGYVYLVWDAISFKNGKSTSEVSVCIENIHLLRATLIPQNGTLQFLITIYEGGNFQVSEAGYEVSKGKVRIVHTTANAVLNEPLDEDATILDNDDVYKELRLRGYNYKGHWKGIEKCGFDFQKGLIQWRNNWITFIDNICQLYILTVPTRSLLVMSHIESITIYPKLHATNNTLLAANYFQETDSIRCGGVQIKHMNADAIHKQYHSKNVLLEEYKFVANELSVSLKESIFINIQVALEINYRNKIKVVEIADNVADNYEPLLRYVTESLSRSPLVEIEATLLTENETSIPNVKVENKEINRLTNVYLIIGSNFLQRFDALSQAFDALIEDGFILSRERLFSCKSYSNVNLLTLHSTPSERLVLISKPKYNSAYKTLKISNDFEWIKPLQRMIKADENVIIYSHLQHTGILGFTNCIRREGNSVRCVYICDKNAPGFDVSKQFYQEQLERGHAVNVFKNGMWGTYRCLPISQPNIKQSEHYLFGSLRREGLQNFTWFTGPLSTEVTLNDHQNLVYVYYSALNFKDVLFMNGRLRKSKMYGLLEKEPIGCEYSGKLTNGKRVMGICASGGCISNLIAADKNLMLEIPSNWTLQDAATVPIVYATVLYALKRGNVKKHHTILIHSGAGGVGQAAINVCHGLGMNIFVTTSSKAKKSFLQTAFPFLRGSHIGCSRDVTFEQVVKRATKGRGVDVVLNSLTEEKFDASVRCLAHRGIFLEIQKSDACNNKPLPSKFLMKEIQFHGIFLDQLFLTDANEVMSLLKTGLTHGLVKPLHRKVFDKSSVSDAFKFMSSGEHFGKILIEVRADSVNPTKKLLHNIPMYYPHGSTIVTGGLGGFGLELIDWLVNRGAKQILISTRKRKIRGYEASRLRIWKQKHVQIKIMTDDISTEEGCRSILEQANKMAPLHAIFHLAAVFSEALFEHHTEESFKQSFLVKAQSLFHLDKLTRTHYFSLKDFVVFSSASTVRSVPGLTNYTYANSVMEAVCDERRKDGLPAIAIQWAVIGDVGQVQRTNQEVAICNKLGMIPQSIVSCLEVLNDVLTFKPTVVSSVALKDKEYVTNCDKSLLGYVSDILGIGNLKKVSMNATLAELGMDSIIATSIKQVLEREFNIIMSYRDLRRQTFNGYAMMSETRERLIVETYNCRLEQLQIEQKLRSSKI